MANRYVREKIGKKFVNVELKSRYGHLSRNRIQKRVFQGESVKDAAKQFFVNVDFVERITQ